MADLLNFHISAEANANIELLRAKYQFSTFTSALKFSLLYALKYHRNEMDFDKLDEQYPSDGTNLNVGTIDDDGIIKRLMPILYPQCETPYRYARVAAIFGAEKIGDKIKAYDKITLAELL